MKRPLAVIGLTYFVTLAVVFLCHSAWVTALLVIGAVSAAAGAVVYRLATHKRRAHYTVIAGCASALCAVFVLFLFQNIKVQPIIQAYAGKTVRAEGYAGDRIQVKNKTVTYTLNVTSVDGAPADVKINYTTYGGYDVEPFDKLAVTLTPQESGYNYSVSKGIYLYAYEEDGANMVLTGEKYFTPYAWAVSLRSYFKQTLNRRLEPLAASMANAVLLGDKDALPEQVYQAFLQTGTSYLIVVSGMHLAVITLLFRRLFRRLERYTAWLPFMMIALLTVGFMAVTGFAASVTRAGVMLLLTYIGKLVFRDYDGFTSLGTAALLMTVYNPCAVGDNGLLLSFAATFGILLWANPINRFCTEKLRLTEKNRLGKSRRAPILRLLKRCCRAAVAFFSTSLAAAVWVLALSVLLFEKLSPLTVVVSLFAYPLTCAVLLLSFVQVLLPFVPLAFFINHLSAWLAAVEQGFAALPFSSIAADRVFVAVWLAVTAVLVLCGYLFRRGRRYVLSAVVLSVLTLSVGSALTALLQENSATLTVWRFGSGYTAMVRRGDNVSLLSCGGSGQGKRVVTDALSHTQRLDHVMVAGSFRQSAAYLPLLLEEKQVGNLLLYASGKTDERISGDGALWFYDNTRFTLALNSDVTLEVFCADNKVFRYLCSESMSVLIVPKKANAARLPASLRRADLVLAEGQADLSAVTARRVLYLTDADSGEVLHDGEVYHLELP